MNRHNADYLATRAKIIEYIHKLEKELEDAKVDLATFDRIDVLVSKYQTCPPHQQ